MAAFPSPLPANVLESLRNGSKLEAIKRLMDATGLGVKEAKDVVEQHIRGVPAAEVLLSGSKIEAVKLLRKETGLGLKEAKDWLEGSAPASDENSATYSPGEVGHSGALVWWAVAVAIVGLVAYRFFYVG